MTEPQTLDDLTLDPENPRSHPEKNLEMIGASLDEVGPVRSIAIDEQGVIRAGNGVTIKARERKLKLKVVDANPDELVAVRRKGLTPEQWRRYSYIDNQTGLTSSWDATQIAAHVAAGMDLSGIFADIEVNAILADANSFKTPPTDDDIPVPRIERADELQAKWQEQPNQLWECPSTKAPGHVHRILCADSTDPANMQRLLGTDRAHICWTDPPYNVAIGTSDSNTAGWRKRNQGLVNDDLGAAFPEFVQKFVTQIKSFTLPGAALYLCMSGQEWPVVDRILRDTGFHWSSTIIWVKDSFVLSRKDYQPQYEPLWYGWNGDAPRLYPIEEDRTQSDVWTIPRPRVSEEHPTMKPLPLVTKALQNSSRFADIVFDPFLGSGTTICVAEALGRIGYGCEIDPRYVAVCLERISEMGLSPYLAE